MTLALRDYAQTTNRQIIFTENLVDGKTAPALNGQYTADDALAKLLSGTDLIAERSPSGAIMIRRVSSISAISTDADLDTAQNSKVGMRSDAGESPMRLMRLAQADASQPQGVAASTPEDPLQEVVVRATEFRYTEVGSANKMLMSVKDTPQTVKVITQDLLRFASIRQFADIYKVDASGGVSHAGDQFPRNYYRGFRQQGINAVKVDGFRLTANINMDLSPFERFEVVKGATSTLYGQNSMGGTLNAISKVPQSEPGGSLDLETGRFSHYRVQGDAYGPLTADGSLAYRLVGAWQEADSFMDFAGSRVMSIAPTLRYQMGESTSLTVRAIHQEFDFSTYFGQGAQFLGTDVGDPSQLTEENFRVLDLPRERFSGMPWNDAERSGTFAQGVLEHRFGNDWQLRGNVQFNKVENVTNGFMSRLTSADGETTTLEYGSDVDDEIYGAEINLFGDVEVLGRAQTLFFGADFAKLESDPLYFYDDAEYVGFSILDPDYGLVAPNRRASDYLYFDQGEERRQLYGFTAQALLRPIENLTWSVGARYSHDEYKARWRGGSPDLVGDFESAPYGEYDSLVASEVTLQSGLTYALTPDLNLYAGYGETFEPQTGLIYSEDGGYFVGPEEGKAYELGVKADAFGNRLSYSVAVFTMERSNITEVDTSHPGFDMAIGKQRSRGVEFEFQGRILQDWEVYGSVAFLDAEYIEGDFAGYQTANAPDFGVSLYTSYQFRSGGLRGLGLGAGVVHKSGLRTFDAFWFGQPVPFDLGDFTEVDLRVFYDMPSWRFELAATNILDEKYYSSAFESMGNSIQVNPPRQLMGRVSYRF